MKKTLLLILILMTSFVLAAPSLPHTFLGTVEYSGNPGMNLEGYDISASISSWELGVLGQVQSGNTYEVFVDTQGRTGEITFYVGGTEATPTATYEWGGHTEDFELIINEQPSNALCGNNIQEPGEQCDNLDLGIGTCENVLGIAGATGILACTASCTFDYNACFAPYCGDSVCNNGETCSTCSSDCGTCSSDSGSSGGGGGGGGGSYVPLSTTDENNTLTLLSGSDLSDGEITLGSGNDKESSGLGITGNTIVDFTSSGKGLGLLLVVIIVVGFIVMNARKKRKL